MARAADKTTQVSRVKPEPRAVYRFVNYDGRFGADTERMKTEVLQYCRWYINAWDGDGGDFLTALNQLRREKDFIWIQGAVVELLTVATNTHREYQGYLFTSRKRPMTAVDVGSILRVDGRKALSVLTCLERVGFLEKVPWPPVDSDGPIPDDPSLRLLRDVEKSARKARQKGGGKGRFHGENKGEPFNNLRNSEAAAQKQVEVTAGGGDAPPPQGGQAAEAERILCPHCGHRGTPKKPAKGFGANAVQCPKCGRVIRPQDATSTSTTSTTSDAGAGLDHANKGVTSRTAGPPSILKIGDILAGQQHRYSQGANDFGEQVLTACGFTTADPAEHVNQVAHFAKLWDQCQAELSAVGVDKALAKVLKIAGRVRGQRHKYECPAAYVEKVMQNAIKDQKRAHRAKSG